jgi:hypothetical protein
VPYASYDCDRAAAVAWYNLIQPQFPAGRDWIWVCYHPVVCMGVSRPSGPASRCVWQARVSSLAPPPPPPPPATPHTLPPLAGTLQQAVLSECVTGWVLALPLLFVTRAHRTWDWRLVLSLGTFEVGSGPTPMPHTVRTFACMSAAEQYLYTGPLLVRFAWWLQVVGGSALSTSPVRTGTHRLSPLAGCWRSLGRCPPGSPEPALCGAVYGLRSVGTYRAAVPYSRLSACSVSSLQEVRGSTDAGRSVQSVSHQPISVVRILLLPVCKALLVHVISSCMCQP